MARGGVSRLALRRDERHGKLQRSDHLGDTRIVLTLPVDAGFYLVSPEARADSPKLSAFRKWLTEMVKSKPEPLAEATPLPVHRFRF